MNELYKYVSGQDPAEGYYYVKFGDLESLVAERDKLVEALAEVREIWAGSDGGEPVHAQEAYMQRLCKQMYKVAVEALTSTQSKLGTNEKDHTSCSDFYHEW